MARRDGRWGGERRRRHRTWRRDGGETEARWRRRRRRRRKPRRRRDGGEMEARRRPRRRRDGGREDRTAATMRASSDDEVEGGERQRRRRRGWRRRVWRGWLLTLTLTLTRVRSRGFSRRSYSELSRRSREAAKSGLGRSGAHRTRSRAAERSSDALPCRSVASRRLGASNAGPRHWRLSSAAAEASDRSWEWRYIDR